MDFTSSGSAPSPSGRATVGERRILPALDAQPLQPQVGIVASVGVTLAVMSQKGGTGKTTTVRTLADVYGRIGIDVLCVDLDPQGNLSDYFDVPADASPTVADVLAGQAKAADALYDSVLPANLGLAEAELILGGKMGRELTLKRALRDLHDSHELILLDCPPSLGLLTVNALVAADHALISSEAEYFSLQGVEQALEVVELARESLNPELEWLGVVLNIADMRLVHAREALVQLRERFDSKVFDTIIRRSVRYAESAERGISILDHAPTLGADYLALADEVLGRLDGFAAERRRLAALRAEVVPA
jgi:chromosome partitioning protein